MQLGNDDENVAQLIVPGSLTSESLITPVESNRAAGGDFVLGRDSLRALDGEPARLSLHRSAARVLVVGASVEDRDRAALAELLTQLLVAGPLALLLAALAGYFVAGAALRPVEAMRRRAEEVSSDRAGRRLPLRPHGTRSGVSAKRSTRCSADSRPVCARASVHRRCKP